MNAFEQFILEKSDNEAATHLYFCMQERCEHNSAWELMAKIHGRGWRIPPEKLYPFLLLTVTKLRQLAKSEMETA